ncbi:unnamed protein product [Cyclocybe aegerita]|uniref:Uncharacterized protein n=1 Tax=Cyclocybe aegerita TaxID=1973307 RepID=A0A8S0WZ15_CYCAE|nr:unnamed protein product [Cyclocybe aegerita]
MASPTHCESWSVASHVPSSFRGRDDELVEPKVPAGTGPGIPARNHDDAVHSGARSLKYAQAQSEPLLRAELRRFWVYHAQEQPAQRQYELAKEAVQIARSSRKARGLSRDPNDGEFVEAVLRRLDMLIDFECDRSEQIHATEHDIKSLNSQLNSSAVSRVPPLPVGITSPDPILKRDYERDLVSLGPQPELSQTSILVTPMMRPPSQSAFAAALVPTQAPTTPAQDQSSLCVRTEILVPDLTPPVGIASGLSLAETSAESRVPLSMQPVVTLSESFVQAVQAVIPAPSPSFSDLTRNPIYGPILLGSTVEPRSCVSQDHRETFYNLFPGNRCSRVAEPLGVDVSKQAEPPPHNEYDELDRHSMWDVEYLRDTAILLCQRISSIYLFIRIFILVARC